MKNNNMNIVDAMENRDKIIVQTSIVGIIANLFLAGFKAAVGLLSHSIAIVLDAVNNLSDALSSVITIVGTKLANRLPDKKHPLGYGRIEYLSAMIVAAIVLYAGGTSLVESIKKLIHPEKADYSTVTLVIIAVAILVKIVLGRFVKSRGEKVNSGALIASGADASFDAILSASVLASALIYVFTGVSLEAIVGVVISIFIIKSGIEMLQDTLDDILGVRPDRDMSIGIKRLICEEPEVRGAYDLIINNYGPNRNYASVHIEVPDTMTVEELDVLTRHIEAKVYKETGVILTGVGVYSYNTKDDEVSKIRNKVVETVIAHDFALQMHGFYVDIQTKQMRFDVVFSFEIDASEGIEIIMGELKALFPEYNVQIAPDVDVTD
ncbi:MAG: cation diffusion facilitator family transporter [Pseudobutyrivibrio sp.]|nr:cation diffusion facilitator family transporter [Pseudobutyrivibrio sp.]